MISKYIIVPIYLIETANQQDIEAVITCEAHLVDGLKAKILININIMSSEQINIIILKK